MSEYVPDDVFDPVLVEERAFVRALTEPGAVAGDRPLAEVDALQARPGSLSTEDERQ